MRMTYDRKANAIYVYLSDKPYAYGKDLDDERRIDYAVDGTPMGLEFLCVSDGVNLDDIPQRQEVERLLVDRDIKVYV